MTQDDIVRMAREAGLVEPYHPYNPWSASQEGLERFAALVAAHEREAISQMFDDSPKLIPSAQNSEGGCLICGFTPSIAAAAIRARGEK